MFNKEEFMNYIKNEFPTCFSEIGGSWTWNMIENIVDYGLENKNYSKNQLLYFLADMIPDIEFEEIKQFYHFGMEA